MAQPTLLNDDADADDDDVTPKTQLIRFLCHSEAGSPEMGPGKGEAEVQREATQHRYAY